LKFQSPAAEDQRLIPGDYLRSVGLHDVQCFSEFFNSAIGILESSLKEGILKLTVFRKLHNRGIHLRSSSEHSFAASIMVEKQQFSNMNSILQGEKFYYSQF
jgi:hypothetical protein